MCGILGFYGVNNIRTRELVKQLMLQLSLRGTHATGIAVLVDHQIRNLSMPVDAKTFFDRMTLDSPRGNGEELRLVGHTRYSTSDLRWNQPICNGYTAIVMNGVISQEPPDKWPRPCDIQYDTGNDTEVALAYADHGQRGKMPGSWAICELEINGSLLCYRNEFRPLWRASDPEFSVVASTADALLRCGLHPHQMPAGRVLDLESGAFIEDFAVGSELQPNLTGLWPNLQCQA